MKPGSCGFPSGRRLRTNARPAPAGYSRLIMRGGTRQVKSGEFLRPGAVPRLSPLQATGRLFSTPLFHSRMIRPVLGAWERGRPARILSLWPPLSFSAMLQAATLWARTPSARPKESHGAVAGRSKWGRWPRLCQALCGRDARAPRKPSSHDIVTPRAQVAEACWCRLSLKEVHLSSGLFVFIRVHSWFVFMNDRLFFLV